MRARLAGEEGAARRGAGSLERLHQARCGIVAQQDGPRLRDSQPECKERV